MRERIIGGVKRGLARYGYELRRHQDEPDDSARVDFGGFPDFDEATRATIDAVVAYTMTGPERIYALCQAVRHVVEHDVPARWSSAVCGAAAA